MRNTWDIFKLAPKLTPTPFLSVRYGTSFPRTQEKENVNKTQMHQKNSVKKLPTKMQALKLCLKAGKLFSKNNKENSGKILIYFLSITF